MLFVKGQISIEALRLFDVEIRGNIALHKQGWGLYDNKPLGTSQTSELHATAPLIDQSYSFPSRLQSPPLFCRPPV